MLDTEGTGTKAPTGSHTKDTEILSPEQSINKIEDLWWPIL
jgi:hypothetical protein